MARVIHRGHWTAWALIASAVLGLSIAASLVFASPRGADHQQLRAGRVLTVTTSKHNAGVVVGPGIDCPSDCRTVASRRRTVTLSAAPRFGYTFLGWGGACAGTGSCHVSMKRKRNVTANF